MSSSIFPSLHVHQYLSNVKRKKYEGFFSHSSSLRMTRMSRVCDNNKKQITFVQMKSKKKVKFAECNEIRCVLHEILFALMIVLGMVQ